MIPRTRANFSLGDLAAASVVREAGGEHKARFSSQLCSYLGARDVLLTPSGRCGLYAILKAVDRPRVIVPAYTCNAVIEAAMLAGKSVDYAEVEADGFNVDVNALGPLLGRDAVFVATHQFGIPCDIDRIVTMCRDTGALVVEDAAASLGTRVGGRLTGTFGDAAFFSFDISKLVTVPLKGGAVIARDEELFTRICATYAAEIVPMPAREKARLLAMATALVALQGERRYQAFHAWQFERTGRFTAESAELHLDRTSWYRYDFTNWQAFIAARQMDRIDEIVERRRFLYAEYERRLRESRAFETPPRDTDQEWAPIRFPVRVRGDKLALYGAATKRGIDFAFSFTFIAAPARFEAAHALANAVLDLPFFYDLTEEELDRTVKVLHQVGRSC
jgi:dTDP-4-amino-4,6-dideoxygalactose transaminase